MRPHVRLLVLTAALAGSAGFLSARTAMAQRPLSNGEIPSIHVTGRGEVIARPDRAVVRLGASAQSPRAEAAQAEVNRIVSRASDALRRLGIASEDLRTASVSLFPVYGDQPSPRDRETEPRIVGYRATNVLQIRVNRIDRVGDVIDAAVREGATNIEGVSFELSDPTAAREEALRLAVSNGRATAEAMAGALGVRLDTLIEATDVTIPGMPPHPMMTRELAAATPIEPGTLTVEAIVALRYAIAGLRGR